MTPRFAWLALACLPLILAASVHAASTMQPRIQILKPRLEATDLFVWLIPIQVNNPLPVGVFCDSITLTFDDLDQGRTRAAKQPVRRNALKQMTPISAGDSMAFMYEGPALAERARITLQLHAHDQSNRPLGARVSQEIFPGRSSRRFASRFLSVGGRKIETVFLPSAKRNTPAPGLLLVHGHASHARQLLPLAWTLANRGFAVMLLSQPGYGLSEGDADLMGPATLTAASAALDQLERTAGVDSTRLGAWGWSRGATVIAELAVRRPELKAIVTQSGIYDLWATWRDTRLEGFREAIVAEAGSDSAAWKARSPLLDHGRIKSSTLILHGERDTNVPFGQAQAFFAALRGDGVSTEARFFDEAGHALPPERSFAAAYEFLVRELAP